MPTYRLNRTNVLRVIGRALTARVAFTVGWNGKRFEIILPATFDVAEVVPSDARVTPWLEPKPQVRAGRGQQ
jgi:hypothetical protein